MGPKDDFRWRESGHADDREVVTTAAKVVVVTAIPSLHKTRITIVGAWEVSRECGWKFRVGEASMQVEVRRNESIPSSSVTETPTEPAHQQKGETGIVCQ